MKYVKGWKAESEANDYGYVLGYILLPIETFSITLLNNFFLAVMAFVFPLMSLTLKDSYFFYPFFTCRMKNTD